MRRSDGRCQARWYAWAMLCLMVVASASAADLPLVVDGKARVSIVRAADTAEKVKAAAADLHRYLEKITGADVPLLTDADNPQGALILVGRSKLTDGMGLDLPRGLTNVRREEGFVIVCRGDRLVLSGNDAGPYHGTEYAVYELLNRFGVRWFMPGDFGEIVPRRGSLSVPEMEVTGKPDFVMRDWWLHITPELAGQERIWKIRNKMNPDTRDIFAIPGDSSVRNVLPPPETMKTKPDLFAMNTDGTRNPYYPDLTNPDAVAYAAGVIKEYFRKNPQANSYGFAPDDGMPRDYSPETLKLSIGLPDLSGRPGIPAEMSTTEEWIAFVNKVTAEVRRDFPEIYIATNGYANRNIPPQGVKLDDHLVIMFAAIWSCTLHAYDDAHCWQKVRQGELLRQWCDQCRNVWIYGYNYQMLVSGLTPLPEFTKLRRDFPLMKKWGVMGFFDENRNVWAEAGLPSRYLRARLEWDADADVNAILTDFFDKWYGAAAKPMRAFYMALDAAVARSPMHGHEDRVLPEVYTPGLMKTLTTDIDDGQRLADTPEVKLRVRADRLIYDHLRAYVAMSAADLQGDFAGAANAAQRMLDLRKDIHAVSKFLIWPDEDGYHTGVWYWKILDRKGFYQSLADRMSGKTGRLVAMCPTQAQFRIDPHDDGRFQGWYRPDSATAGWQAATTTVPFFRQGYDDAAGHPYVGAIWYRLTVPVPASAKGARVMLFTPNLTTEGWCWVNGSFVGYRPYEEAYIRPAQMECDVSRVLLPGRDNVIVYRVSTSLSEAQGAEGLFSRPFLYTPIEKDSASPG